jgi:hypothetical protein
MTDAKEGKPQPKPVNANQDANKPNTPEENEGLAKDTARKLTTPIRGRKKK